MTEHNTVWQCPKCPRQIPMNWGGWEFSKNSHEKSHKAKSSSPGSGSGGSGSSGNIIGGIVEGIGEVLSSILRND